MIAPVSLGAARQAWFRQEGGAPRSRGRRGPDSTAGRRHAAQPPWGRLPLLRTASPVHINQRRSPHPLVTVHQGGHLAKRVHVAQVFGALVLAGAHVHGADGQRDGCLGRVPCTRAGTRRRESAARRSRRSSVTASNSHSTSLPREPGLVCRVGDAEEGAAAAAAEGAWAPRLDGRAIHLMRMAGAAPPAQDCMTTGVSRLKTVAWFTVQCAGWTIQSPAVRALQRKARGACLDSTRNRPIESQRTNHFQVM